MTSPLDQKLRISGAVVVTANRLADGAVVYRTTAGEWTTRLDEAAITESASLARSWLAAANDDGIAAVSAYVAPVTRGADGRVQPGNLRERIRADGPTISVPAAI